MRPSFINVCLLLTLLLSSNFAAYGQQPHGPINEIGAPHMVESFVDVVDCNRRLKEDIQEVGKPIHTKAEIWICIWAWANSFLLDPPNTLLDEVKKALTSNPNLKVYVLLWEMPLGGRVFLNLGWERFDEALAMRDLPEQVKQRFIVTRESLFLKHSLSSAHQKFVLIDFGDDSAAYCLDYNFQNFHFDWADHDALKRMDLGLKLPPVHDTGVRFKGPAIDAFRKEFLRRWEKVDRSKHTPDAKFTVRLVPGPMPFLTAHFQEPGMKGGPIEDWYTLAIRNAKNYIYLESQYFDDTDVGDELIKAYFRGLTYPQPNIVLNLCSTAVLEPKSQVDGTLRETMRVRLSTADTIELNNGHVIKRIGQWRNVSVNHNATVCTLRGKGFNSSIKLSDIKALHGGVLFITMVTATAAPKLGFQPIYIHSKIGLIDNHLTVGSANLNRRSFGLDYEANVMVTDTKETDEVATFRKRIFHDLFAAGVTGTDSFAQLQQTADMNLTRSGATVPTNPVGMVIHYPCHK